MHPPHKKPHPNQLRYSDEAWEAARLAALEAVDAYVDRELTPEEITGYKLQPDQGIPPTSAEDVDAILACRRQLKANIISVITAPLLMTQFRGSEELGAAWQHAQDQMDDLGFNRDGWRHLPLHRATDKAFEAYTAALNLTPESLLGPQTEKKTWKSALASAEDCIREKSSHVSEETIRADSAIHDAYAQPENGPADQRRIPDHQVHHLRHEHVPGTAITTLRMMHRYAQSGRWARVMENYGEGMQPGATLTSRLLSEGIARYCEGLGIHPLRDLPRLAALSLTKPADKSDASDITASLEAARQAVHSLTYAFTEEQLYAIEGMERSKTLHRITPLIHAQQQLAEGSVFLIRELSTHGMQDHLLALYSGLRQDIDALQAAHRPLPLQELSFVVAFEAFATHRGLDLPGNPLHNPPKIGRAL